LAIKSMCRFLAAALAMLVCIAVPTGTGLAAPTGPTLPQLTSRNANLGGGAYSVVATVFAEGTDGQVGSTASSGHVIQPNDNLVALPGCTESSCPWVPLGTGVEGRYGPQTSCAEDDGLCWVEIVSDETGMCTVAPVHDRGPLFVRDNWWAAQSEREYDVPQGIPAAEYAADGVDVGFGPGISDVGLDIQNVYTHAAGIDLAGGTWKAIGLSTSSGITTVTVTMLWQAGISHEGACGGDPGSGETGGNASTTSSLNLRSEPSTSASVLLVMSAGSRVTVLDVSENGFYPVDYRGTEGWAFGDYLEIDSGEDPGPGDGGEPPPPPTDDSPTATVIDGSLNLRSGPSTGSSVILVMPDGALVTLTGESSGGFLSVSYQGTAGWAYAAYLDTGDDGSIAPPPSTDGPEATVVGGSLNLRSGPGTGYSVILVMPSGSTVTLTGEESGGFSSVAYNGTAGWAYSAYLGQEDGGVDTPPPGTDGPSATVVDGSLNLRSGPGTSYAVILVMPDGAEVTLTGESSGDFVSVDYQGTAGWAHAGYLEEGGSPPSGTGDTATVTSSLNLRAGASTGSAVLLVMPTGAVVELTGESSNGFLGVIYRGTAGFAYAAYLSTDGAASTGDTATVVDGALNLRSSPSTDAAVLLVMPDGATVTLNGDEENGFVSVTYQGTSGWAYGAYLV
jgi:uncharacterized protein YraI